MNRTQKIARGILVLYGIIIPLAIWRLFNLGFNYDFEAFFPINDEETHFFLSHRKHFGPDNDFVLVGIYRKEGIFNKEFFHKINEFEEKIHRVPYIEEVNSPLKMKEILRDPLFGSPVEIPFIHVENPELYSTDSVRIWQTPELLGQYFSKDGKSICLVLHHTPYIGDTACQPLTDSLKRLANEFDFDEIHIAGRCIGQSYYVDIIKNELGLFLGIAFLFIIIVLWVIYRSIWGTLLPLLVVGSTVLFTMTLMEMTGKELDVMTNIIPTILVVVGLSVAVHLQTKFLDYRDEGLNAFEALKAAIRQVGLPSLFTSLTTAVGFGSLTTINIAPITDFGTYAAMGVGLSFCISFTLLPAMLLLVPLDAPKKVSSRKWHLFLGQLFTWVIRRQKLIVVSSFLITGLSIFGIFQVKENTYLLEDLSPNNAMYQDFMFFGKNYSGTRPLELSVKIKEGTSFTIFSREVLETMLAVEEIVLNHYPTEVMYSPLTLVRVLNRSLSGGQKEAYTIPESSSRLRQIEREIRQLGNKALLKRFLSEDFRYARMQALIPDLGSAMAWELRKNTEAEMNKVLRGAPVEIRITGTAELIDKNNRSLSINIAQGLCIAFILITLIITLLFRSWKMVLISMVPNIMPMLILGGTMGLLGISLKISTAILFTIAFGIAVDDTIHFLGKLKTERAKTQHLPQAIKNTFIATGKPIVITTILLCAGFLILGLSDFQATKMIGLLISFVLLVALLADLLLLPILLLWFVKRNPKQSNVKKL